MAATSEPQEDSKFTRTAIRQMRVARLREELEKRGLETTGIREVLMGRLLDANENTNANASSDSTKTPPIQSSSKENSSDQCSPDKLYVLRFRGHTTSSYSSAGVGLILYDTTNNKEVWSGRKYYFDSQSRFEAEYKGITIGLRVAYKKGVRRLVLQGDNHVIVNQLGGNFNVRKKKLQHLYWATIDLKEQFEQFEVQPINSTENSAAKSLASRAVATKKSYGLEGQDKPQKESFTDEDAAKGKPREPAPSPTCTQDPIEDEQAPRDHHAEEPENDDGGEATSPIEPHRRYLLRFDGGSRGNPGIAGAGMVIYDDQAQEVWCGWKFMDGRATNNEAEYTSLIVGLQCAQSLGITNVRVEGDSELIVRQLDGRYQVKSGRLQVLYQECKELVGSFDNIEIRHIPRAQNHRADELANQAMDSRESFGFVAVE